MFPQPQRCTIALVLLAAFGLCGCGQDSDPAAPPHRLAVLSAFPAELAAYLGRASVSETVPIGERTFRLGVLGGVPVVMGLTGIGLVNATETTRAVLARFAVGGIVVSGVAGSALQIGDVTVPATWETADGSTYAVERQWLALTGDVAAAGSVALDRCTTVAAAAMNPVCLPQTPAIVVGGLGESSDAYGNLAFPCQPNGGDLFGCDVVSTSAAAAVLGFRALPAPAVAAAAPVVDDMETAAIAAEAAARGLPFIAFRAVSDGAGDPLGLPGFPQQFSAYYHLAAHNAAAAMVAFLGRLGTGAAGD